MELKWLDWEKDVGEEGELGGSFKIFVVNWVRYLFDFKKFNRNILEDVFIKLDKLFGGFEFFIEVFVELYSGNKYYSLGLIELFLDRE